MTFLKSLLSSSVMRNGCVATLAASLGLSMFAAIGGMTAEAGSRSYSSLQQAPGKLSIDAPSANERSIVLPHSKSTVIELPEDARDIIISNPDVVSQIQHTARRTLLIGSQPGQTNVFFYGQDGKELLRLDVRVERDIKGLKALISQHVESRDIEVQSINDNILLTGAVPNAAAAQRLQSLAEMWIAGAGGESQSEVINLLAVEGRDQVMLKVRIVEMQRSVTKQLGINLSSVAALGDATVSLFSANGIRTGAGFAADAVWNNSGGGDLRSIGASLQALERVGLVRTLAEPSVVAISGETASFLSGGEFPLLTGVAFDDTGRLVRQFEFKPYGVSLGFTPVVLSEGRISLSISTEVSEPTTEGSFETGGVSSDILGLRVRRAESVVEMPAGGSLVIAGLIREETRQTSDGTPGVKSLPGIGAAFRNRDDVNTQQELMIIVTPYLVEPTHPDNLKTPIDGFQQASDGDSLLNGRINRVYGDTPSTGAPRLSGSFGHVVD